MAALPLARSRIPPATQANLVLLGSKYLFFIYLKINFKRVHPLKNISQKMIFFILRINTNKNYNFIYAGQRKDIVTKLNYDGTSK